MNLKFIHIHRLVSVENQKMLNGLFLLTVTDIMFDVSFSFYLF